MSGDVSVGVRLVARENALVDALLLALRPGEVRWLRRVAEQDGALSEAQLSACPFLRPLLVAGQVPPRLPHDLCKLLLERMDDVLHDRGFAAEVIEAAGQGVYDKALAVLRDHGGAFVSMVAGLEVAHEIANAFPETATMAFQSLGLLRVVNALKAGDLARADLLMDETARHFDLPPLEACQPTHDPELVCVLFMKAVYADEPVSEGALERLFATLRALPADASLMRGLLYNVGLDILMRRNQIATADEAAQRALYHYAAAGEVGLGFYIHLYLVITALWQGDVMRAGKAVAAAELALSAYAGQGANDAALLRGFALIQRYEAGEVEAFLHHLVSKGDTIPPGELWPAMAEPILSYGRRALAAYATPTAALSWVRRWRLRQWRSQRFDALISVQEALALQDLGRFQEADEVLSGVEGGGMGDVQIARLAAALDRAPGAEELAQKIKQAVEAPGQALRQRLVLALMAAESATLRRNEREAAGWLSRVFDSDRNTQISRVLCEERPRLARILANRALRAELRRLPQLNRALEEVMAGAAPALPENVTRQEYRVLLLLAEALPNKLIAQRLGLSLSTVKFHIGNLLAKAGVANRKALVAHARAVGWLAEL